MHAQTHQASAQATHHNRYVDDAEAGEILGLSRSYLRQLRLKGGGPRFCSFGRAIRYSVTELHAWAASKSASSTSEREAA
jgi:predicted DNA-binding transcriptional regulator AlpA